MDFHSMSILSFLLVCLLQLTLAMTKASLPAAELYWNSKLPDTTMPLAIKEISRPDFQMGKVNDAVLNALVYNKYASAVLNGPQSAAILNKTLFFLPKDMVPRNQIKMDVPNSGNDAPFVSRHVADSIPFSLGRLPEILKHFSIKPKSAEARMIKTTLKTCQLPGIIGEDKFCATSLESMVDFVISNLGKNQVQAISTEIGEENRTKVYTIMDEGVKKMSDDHKTVVCHKLNYPYATFYCHAIPATSAYTISLLDAANGLKSNVVALCHKDTTAWDPNQIAFKLLKVKPGFAPICHVLPDKDVVWFHN